ncbi:MAG: hypothetical protein MUQ56_05220 [Thermoleophilia bacterium]|nr:hypothetical protein [Thermoleophilia bacterium]
MSSTSEEQELVAYFEELLAAQLVERRESGGPWGSSELEVVVPAAPAEEMPAAPPEEESPAPAEEEEPAAPQSGAQSVSPGTALREVFSGLPLGSSRAAGPDGPPAPPASGRPPSEGRPGDALRMLFGAATVGKRAAAPPAAPPAVAPLEAPATTGVAELDRCLGAGFPPGLWLVTADVTADATAFLEAAVWEAATRQRPVLYLALTGGMEAVRARFQVTLGHVLGDDRELDSILRRTVLRHVRFVVARELVDSVIAGPDPVGHFLRDLESAIAEPTARVGMAPVVAVDDLGALLRFLGAPSRAQSARALEGMDAVLRRRRAPGLITAGPDVTPALAGSGRVELHRRGRPQMQNETVPMDAQVVDYSSGGRPGTVRLVYHRSAGMFAPAS